MATMIQQVPEPWKFDREKPQARHTTGKQQTQRKNRNDSFMTLCFTSIFYLHSTLWRVFYHTGNDVVG